MKRLLSCIKGGGTVEGPFGNNEELNNAWRNNIELPDDREEAIANAPPFPTFPPLPANCGETILWQEIFDGTLKFGRTYFLGRGSFGDVYRCDLPRTNQVGAVKIQNRDNPSGQSEFVAEVTTLHAASHPNVIRLLGKWYGRRNRVIVYEFMPNGSLDRHLFAQASQGQGSTSQGQGSTSQGQGTQGLLLPRRVLDWETRMRIAVGVAKGLVYLHQELKVINQDVKAENVLLDENFVPKLTDFGLATKIVRDGNGIEQQSESNPTKGTLGYIAPEAQESGLISTKCDVYSYGVFLLVLFSGKKAFDMKRPEGREKLTDWLMRLEARVEEYPSVVADVKLGNKISLGGLSRIIHTVRRCTKAQALERPAMSDVETMVREAADFPVQPVPTDQRRRSDA